MPDLAHKLVYSALLLFHPHRYHDLNGQALDMLDPYQAHFLGDFQCVFEIP